VKIFKSFYFPVIKRVVKIVKTNNESKESNPRRDQKYSNLAQEGKGTRLDLKC
jgi:hypothetical protein